MLALKVICDNTYFNKFQSVISQSMFALRKINQIEHKMCSYLEWQPAKCQLITATRLWIKDTIELQGTLPIFQLCPSISSTYIYALYNPLCCSLITSPIIYLWPQSLNFSYKICNVWLQSYHSLVSQDWLILRAWRDCKYMHSLCYPSVCMPQSLSSLYY